MKHWIIATTQGHDASVTKLMEAYKRGFVSGDNLAVALRAHKAAV